VGYLFFAILRERLRQESLDPDIHLEAQFKAHLSRGVLMLYQRLKNLEDLADLVAEAQQRMKEKYPDLEKEMLYV
jgi:DNA sulfur modification protein DndE